MRSEERESPAVRQGSPRVVIAELAGSAAHGGGERYLELLIERLDRARFRPLLICPEPGPFLEVMRNRGVPSTMVHLSPLVNPLALFRLASLLRRERVTILQTHGARSNCYGALAGRLAGVPVIISTVHNSLLDYEVGELRRWVYVLAKRLTIHLADRIICVSAALRQYALDLFQTAPERTVTIYNGIDLTQFNPAQNGAAVRARLQVERGPLVLAVGRLASQKGHRYLIEALPYLIGEWPSLRCVIVGGGELLDDLTVLADRLGVARYCHFAGVWSNVAEVLAAADVVVLPSVSEGFPFVLLEALALAKPVIASNVHAVYELIEDRKNGVLVPARDARALAEGIRLVLRDPARAAEMGRQGRQAVQDRFTVEQMVGQTVALFEAALRGERTSPAEDKQAAGTSSWAGSLHSIGCPCGSPLPARLVFRTATRRYVRCPACRLVFLSPRPPADTIQQFYREEYDRTYGRVESGPGRISVFRSVSRHLGRYRKPPGRLLDVGCGDGHFLELCRESGWTTYGLELSRAATERGLRRGLTMLPHDWLDKAARTGTEESEKDRFDVITLINVLETVPDPAAMLQSVRQALAPGGILLVRVGNGGFHLFLRRPVRWLGGRYQQAFHLFVYPPEALLHLLRDAGFAPLSVRNSRPSTAPLSGGERRMRRALWQATGEAFWALAQGAFWLTGRRAIWAPSFELIARAK